MISGDGPNPLPIADSTTAEDLEELGALSSVGINPYRGVSIKTIVFFGVLCDFSFFFSLILQTGICLHLQVCNHGGKIKS